MNLPRVYTCSPSWTPLPPPPHINPLGHPSVPALSILYHASNLDWRFISHILYMFQCHPPKSSHLSLSHRIQKTVLDICVSFAVWITTNCWKFFEITMKCSEVTQSCTTLCNPMDYSLPRSSVHGIFQAIVLEWTAISFRESSWLRNRARVSCIVDRCFTVWATREVHY